MKKILLLLSVFAFIWFGGFKLRSMGVNAEEIAIEDTVQSSESQEGTETEPLAEMETMPETYQVTGYAKWWDDKYQYGWADNTSLHPLCRIRVELIDGTDGKIWGETYTTDIGYFNFQFTTDLEISTNQIYVKLYAESHNTMVVTTTGNYIGSVYSVESERKTFALSNSLTFNVNVDMTTVTGQAFQVSQAVIMAAEYAGEMNGEAFSGVVVEYPHQRIRDGVIGKGAFFSAPSTICISGILEEPLVNASKQYVYLQAYSSWDVIMHEYGHFVAYRLGIEDSPGGTHYMENNCIDLERWDELGVDAKEKGVKLAWSEGYATNFAIIAQQYFNGNNLNIEGVGNNGYNAYNMRIKTSYELESENSVLLGEGHEYAVAVALYDLYDANNESGDTIFWGHQKLFDLIKDSQATTFSSFLSYLYEEGHIDKSSYGEQLRNCGMAVSNYQIDYSGEFPKLIWTGNGGSTRHPYNAFSVIIYAEDGAEVFSKGIIDASSYTFTADEWRKILYGYGETITIEIAAYQTTNFMTGPYYAETTIEKANSTLSYGTMFAFSQRYIESSQTLSPGQVWQYYLYNEAAGWKVIQSFGGKNVMIELRDSNGNFIASDNNSGYENNSFIRYNLQGNTEYLIRIYLYDYKDSGTVKVSIFAAHNLGYHYEGIKNYDNVLISLTYTTYATQGYMQAITFTAPLSGRYKFSLQSTFDNYIYIIDPRSNEILVENINYNDNASGLNASLTIRLNGNVPYLIVFGAKDPSAPFTNFDEGDDLVLKVTRQLF